MQLRWQAPHLSRRPFAKECEGLCFFVLNIRFLPLNCAPGMGTKWGGGAEKDGGILRRGLSMGAKNEGWGERGDGCPIPEGPTCSTHPRQSRGQKQVSPRGHVIPPLARRLKNMGWGPSKSPPATTAYDSSEGMAWPAPLCSIEDLCSQAM